jgi:hypothetical protein
MMMMTLGRLGSAKTGREIERARTVAKRHLIRIEVTARPTNLATRKRTRPDIREKDRILRT